MDLTPWQAALIERVKFDHKEIYNENGTLTQEAIEVNNNEPDHFQEVIRKHNRDVYQLCLLLPKIMAGFTIDGIKYYKINDRRE